MLLRVTTSWVENCENNEEIRLRIKKALEMSEETDDPKLKDVKVELVSEPLTEDQCIFSNVSGVRCWRPATRMIGGLKTCHIHAWWALDRLQKTQNENI